VWEAVRWRSPPLPPGVPTFCFFSDGVASVAAVDYATAGFEDASELHLTAGKARQLGFALTAVTS
jgi:hypothetical protein